MAYRRGVLVAAQALRTGLVASSRNYVGVANAGKSAPVNVPAAAAAWGISRGFAADSGAMTKEEAAKVLEEKYEHATGVEREELEALIMGGRPRFETGPPQGPFGTADAPAIVEAEYDERLVGCSGGYGEDEHDVIWFNLTKDAPFTCPDCGQVFKLSVIGPGGKPGGH